MNPHLVAAAEDEASRFGLHAMDGLHIVAAKALQANEFITTERLAKPLYRVTGLKIISLYSLA